MWKASTSPNFYDNTSHNYDARGKSPLFGSAIFSNLPCLHKLTSWRRPGKKLLCISFQFIFAVPHRVHNYSVAQWVGMLYLTESITIVLLNELVCWIIAYMLNMSSHREILYLFNQQPALHDVQMRSVWMMTGTKPDLEQINVELNKSKRTSHHRNVEILCRSAI